MSNLVKMLEIVDLAKPQFDSIAKIHGAVNWPEECLYAKQLLQKNDYLCRVAAANPDSLQRAIIGVASVGLSLNPHKALAYLVPRKGEVCLDVSWRGYVQQALDINSIQWAAVELRHLNDTFIYEGMSKAPVHKFDPDDERGALRGGYCIARLANGDELVTYMTIEEVNSIRDRTESWKSFKKNGTSTPWNTDPKEMVKKTIIRRAWKMWPKKDLSRAAALEEVVERIDPIYLAPAPAPQDNETTDLLLKMRTALDILGKAEASFVGYLVRVFHRSEDLKKLEDLTKTEMKEALTMLGQLVDEKNAREQKNEKT